MGWWDAVACALAVVVWSKGKLLGDFDPQCFLLKKKQRKKTNMETIRSKETFRKKKEMLVGWPVHVWLAILFPLLRVVVGEYGG